MDWPRGVSGRLKRLRSQSFLSRALTHGGNAIRTFRGCVMKRIVALALATFLALGLLSTSLSAARDALHGVTSWSGDYSIE